MIIYALQTSTGSSQQLYATKALAVKFLNEIKSKFDGSDRIIIDTETEFEIERSYDYGWFRKGTVSVKWSIKEINVKEE